MKSSFKAAGPLVVFALAWASQAHATCFNLSYPTIGLEPISANSPSTAPAWNASQAYNQGAKVQYNGLEYQARWWTQGNAPGSSTGDVWDLTIPASGIPQPWQSTQVYYGGEQTLYQGNIYSAKNWTKGDVPGSSASWVFVRQADPFAKVTLSGTFTHLGCSSLSASSQPNSPTKYGADSLDLPWSITSDPDHVFAYWKQIDDSSWKTAAQGNGVELSRGTAKQGELKADWTYNETYACTNVTSNGQTTTQCVLTSSQYTGASQALYLCSAKNECRKVIGTR